MKRLDVRKTNYGGLWKNKINGREIEKRLKMTEKLEKREKVDLIFLIKF